MKTKSSILTLSILILMGGGISLYKWKTSTPHPALAPVVPSPVAKTPVPIAPEVLILLSEQPLGLNERLDAMRLIRRDLPNSDRQALLRALASEKPPGLSHDDWFSLANDIMLLLRNQQPATAEITPTLLAIWHNHQLEPTIRDYALQHLREWVHDYDTRTTHEFDPIRIKEIQQNFFTLTDPAHVGYDPASTSLGTALLALDEWHNSSHPHPMIDTQFEQRVLGIVSDSAVHRGNRATALQIASQRKLLAALPAARAVLLDSASDIILRLAAINFLGTNGEPNDKIFLLAYQQKNSREALLQSCLTKALQTLDSHPQP